ncbi:MAG: hypothetical protein FD126_3695, partial [Elusimicrobia bacterium]
NDPIFNQGREIVLEEYLEGREWDADIVMQGGRMLYHSVTDNWPTREPYFLATGSSLPSRRLSAAEQAESVSLSERTLGALGLADGVFHVEGKATSKGPRILEVNVRPGGVYVVQWNETVNGVNLAEMLFLTAADIPAAPYKPAAPLTHLEGEFLIPGLSGRLERLEVEGRDRHPGFHELLTIKQVGSTVSVPPNGYDRVGMLVARGDSSEEAVRHLGELKAGLTMEISPPAATAKR